MKQISGLPIPHWHRIAKAIYSVRDTAPCVHTCGGQHEAFSREEDL